jgi:hypothetical protein
MVKLSGRQSPADADAALAVVTEAALFTAFVVKWLDVDELVPCTGDVEDWVVCCPADEGVPEDLGEAVALMVKGRAGAPPGELEPVADACTPAGELGVCGADFAAGWLAAALFRSVGPAAAGLAAAAFGCWASGDAASWTAFGAAPPALPLGAPAAPAPAPWDVAPGSVEAKGADEKGDDKPMNGFASRLPFCPPSPFQSEIQTSLAMSGTEVGDGDDAETVVELEVCGRIEEAPQPDGDASMGGGEKPCWKEPDPAPELAGTDGDGSPDQPCKRAAAGVNKAAPPPKIAMWMTPKGSSGLIFCSKDSSRILADGRSGGTVSSNAARRLSQRSQREARLIQACRSQRRIARSERTTGE